MRSPTRCYEFLSAPNINLDEVQKRYPDCPDIYIFFKYLKRQDIPLDEYDLADTVFFAFKNSSNAIDSIILVEKNTEEIVNATGLSKRIIDLYRKVFFDIGEMQESEINIYIESLGEEDIFKKISWRLGKDFVLWYYWRKKADDETIIDFMKKFLQYMFFFHKGSSDIVKKMSDAYVKMSMSIMSGKENSEAVEQAQKILKDLYNATGS